MDALLLEVQSHEAPSELAYFLAIADCYIVRVCYMLYHGLLALVLRVGMCVCCFVLWLVCMYYGMYYGMYMVCLWYVL